MTCHSSVRVRRLPTSSNSIAPGIAAACSKRSLASPASGRSSAEAAQPSTKWSVWTFATSGTCSLMDGHQNSPGHATRRRVGQGCLLSAFLPHLRESGQSVERSLNKSAEIAPDVKLGKDVRLAKFINLYGCEIGDETKIGAFVEIQKNATVGRRCKISSHTFICEGVTIEDYVFIGHGVMFINDSYPRATTAGGELQTEKRLEGRAHARAERRVDRIGRDDPFES